VGGYLTYQVITHHHIQFISFGFLKIVVLILTLHLNVIFGQAECSIGPFILTYHTTTG